VLKLPGPTAPAFKLPAAIISFSERVLLYSYLPSNTHWLSARLGTCLATLTVETFVFLHGRYTLRRVATLPSTRVVSCTYVPVPDLRARTERGFHSLRACRLYYLVRIRKCSASQYIVPLCASERLIPSLPAALKFGLALTLRQCPNISFLCSQLFREWYESSERLGE